MPGLSKQRPIKGLNKGPGAKRFVFKSFAQRIEEVDLDVFRSLAPVKLEPTGGTSFLHESLVSWRELNTAVEFTSIYEQLLPIVQTLPQLILHKEVIMHTLLSHLKLSALHSLEPILSLIAIFSRDLRSDFTLFIPRFIGAIVDLFQSGGDREPDIIEQVFTCISYIFKYMQKLLCKDVSFVLKATKRLRYYQRLYVQEFMAEAVSYILRNSSYEQLIKGIRRLLNEVHVKTSKENINSCSSLLWYTLKGPGMTLHSRAEPVLRLVLDQSTLKNVRKKDPGGGIIVDILSQAFLRLFEELDRKKLWLVWSCLLDELKSTMGSIKDDSSHLPRVVNECDSNRDTSHKAADIEGFEIHNEEDAERMYGLGGRNHVGEDEAILNMANILAIVNNLLEFRKGGQVLDFEPLISLSFRLLEMSALRHGERAHSPCASAGSSTAATTNVDQLSFQILRFILDLIKGHSEVRGASMGPSVVLTHAGTWRPLWNCPDYASLLCFIQGLLEQGAVLIQPFLPDLLRVFDGLVYTRPSDILPLMITLLEKMESIPKCVTLQDPQFQRIMSFVVSTIKDATERLIGELLGTTTEVDSSIPACTWAALKCFPYLFHPERCDRLLAWDLVLALDTWLATPDEASSECKNEERSSWEFLLAEALACELKVLSKSAEISPLLRGRQILMLGVHHKNSAHVLKVVADFLDLCFRDFDAAKIAELVPAEMQESRSLSLFEANLGSDRKLLRLSTLRLLNHLECMCIITLGQDAAHSKRRKRMDGGFFKVDGNDSIFEPLRSLEAVPFSLETGRQCSLVLTRLKVKICAGDLPENCLVSLMHALVGMLFNRFGLLWDAVADCLSGLLETRKVSVWEVFTQHLDVCQKQFLYGQDKSHPQKRVSEDMTIDGGLFSVMEHCRQQDEGEITDVGTLITFLLKAAQKVPIVAEGRTRQLVPLFLEFSGHDLERPSDERTLICKGKDWKVVLKEWLILMGSMKNAQSYYKSLVVKEVLTHRFLMDGDPDIQQKSLECVLNWKDPYLIPYGDHLKSLIAPKTAREEITTWNIGKDGDQVQSNHRDGLVPIIMRVLFPKILKTKTSLHNKTTGGVQRKVVLSFLASLDVQELSLFFILILKPLESAVTAEGQEHMNGGHAWELAIKQGVQPGFVDWIDPEATRNLSFKKKTGFLHMVKDVLETFDKSHISPYLHVFLAFLFRILQAGQVTNGQATGAGTTGTVDLLPSVSGTKDLRTLAFKVLAIVFNKYDDAELHPDYWVIFFKTVRPMISRFKEEGASGDYPSSLFSCFLAMSRSPALASVLLQEQEMVPNILPLLSHKSASTSIVDAALSFIENILGMEEEDTSLFAAFFLPHLPILISNLRALFSAHQRGIGGKKFSSSIKRGLLILIRVSKHITSQLDAIQLLDALLPFLVTHKRTIQEELVDVLHVFKELAPNLNRENCEKTLPFLGQLLASSPTLDVRGAVCEVLSAFSQPDPALILVAGLISDLNAISKSTVGEYDYGRRLQAYEHVSAELFNRLTYGQASLIICQAIYDVRSDDISIRHSASNSLSKFVGFLASQCELHGDEKHGDKEGVCAGPSTSHDDTNMLACWDFPSIKLAVQKLLLPNVRESMGLNSPTVRREWVSLLRDMVINLRSFAPLNELLPLTCTDLEVDFFNNISHIQTHRRIRAMGRFKELCSDKGFSQGTLVRIFEPLFTNSLFEGRGDKDGNLVQAAIDVIACIASQLQWDPYNSLLMRLFRMISSRPENEKVMIRLLCAILDKFHFSTASISPQGDESIVQHDEHGTSPQQDPRVGDPSLEPDEEPKQSISQPYLPEEIDKQLRLRILPEFMKLMVSKTGIINVSVALATVKVLQLLPKDVMELELPRILQNIINLLKNRSQVVRDEARSGLLAVVGALGAEYFGFVVGKLQDSLKRGYEVHVLGFTLNALIGKLFPKFQVGEIDYCAERVVTLLENDIFEDIAEEKEVEKMAFKMKEIKRSGSYESLKLMAQIVTFQVHGTTLLKTVNVRLKDALVPKVKGKIERVLKQLATGIQLNPSLKQEELLVFVHGLVEDGMNDERSLNQMCKSEVKSKMIDGAHQSIPNQHLITEFALVLLESHLKREKLSKSDHGILSMLDPMVILLHKSLGSKHGAVLGLAMKALIYLVRLPLPSIDLISMDLITKVLVMAQGFGKIENNQVAQACFNLLVALLKHAKGMHVSEDQLRIILQFPVFVDLERAESNTGLVLLKAIVGRKLLLPELYDLIDRVSHLMVTSHVPLVRQYCSQIMMQFLLDYPLGSKRLQQHLDFFISNLSYENASGRETVLEMLHAVIVKFPPQAVDEQAETLFLSLVTRLVNDESSQLRAMVGTVLKVLMGRVSLRLSQRMLQFCFSWLKGDKHTLWRAAGQVLGFAVEVMQDKYLVHVEDTLNLGVKLLHHVLEISVVEQGETITSVGSALWQEAYHILTLLEKLFRQFPYVYFQETLESLWELLSAFLLHQHVWVRKVSSRLLDGYFTASSAADNDSERLRLRQQVLLLQPSRLMCIAAVLCQQLNSELDNDLAGLLEKNLLLVCVSLHSSVFVGKERISWIDMVDRRDASAETRVAKALRMLRVHRWISKDHGKRSGGAAEAGARHTKGVSFQDLSEAKYAGLFPVFKYLEKVSLQGNDVQVKTVFHLFEGFLTSLGKDSVKPYLSSMLLPLFRTTEGVAAKAISDDVKQVAENVIGLLRETIGTEEFVRAYNETRQMTKNIRDSRRRAKKLKVLVDPEGHTKRKLKLHAKRQIQKKNKRNKMRMESGR